MMDQDAIRFRLAAAAATSALTLIAQNTVQSSTPAFIHVDRQLSTLKDGDEETLCQTLRALNMLADSPRLFAVRLVAAALAQSLPRICSKQVTSQDIHAAASDLRQMANEANLLCAPQVAIKLAGISDALVARHEAPQPPTDYDSRH